MATVVMKKGDRYADIYDSPETIAQARKDGYHSASKNEIASRFPKTNAEESGKPDIPAKKWKQKGLGGNKEELVGAVDPDDGDSAA